MAQAQTAKAGRKDPEPVAELGNGDFSDAFRLRGMNPTRKYMWVPRSTPSSGPGVDYYENIEGWDIEQWTADGPRPLGVKFKPAKLNTELVVLDNVLMSIDAKVWAARRAAGQKKADVIDKKIIRRRGQVDKMRGIGNLHGEQFNNDQYTKFSADYQGGIEPLRQEIGES